MSEEHISFIYFLYIYKGSIVIVSSSIILYLDFNRVVLHDSDSKIILMYFITTIDTAPQFIHCLN